MSAAYLHLAELSAVVECSKPSKILIKMVVPKIFGWIDIPRETLNTGILP
jgi:hypothetical protein